MGARGKAEKGVEDRHPPLTEEIDEVPVPGLQGHVERTSPLELQPVATPQQEERD